MKCRHYVTIALIALGLAVGCHRKSHHHRSNSDRESDGIVEELTGDDDSEVDDDLEDMVYDANQLGDHDEPLDF